MSDKARYWTAVIYPNQLIPDFDDKISELLQIPFCYILHDKDINEADKERRKAHYHIMICFNNTTTYSNALDTFNLLTVPNNRVNICKKVMNVRYLYNYFIHDTDDCKKKGKYLYDKDCRICGNNFDIGSYEQLSLAEKDDIIQELKRTIYNNGFYNFLDFSIYVDENFSIEYSKIVNHHVSLFTQLCKGNYQRLQFKHEINLYRQSMLVSDKYKNNEK